MSERRKKIDKTYLPIPFENDVGLSTYDLALISLAKKYKRTKRLKKEDYQDLLAA
tara:strand:+ start:64 stop:228 length:165 start_codon:yes stop_codon:yes gene_type:complete